MQTRKLLALLLIMVALPSLAQGAHSVALTCTASPDPVSGYQFFKATTSGNYTTPLNVSPVTACALTDAAVTAGQKLFYVARAISIDGLVQSPNSNEAQAVIPLSPPVGLVAVPK